ncbi:MAG: hydroxyethylthiazole kinase [Hyphomicrobiales bacterium]|nr:hydroxyethylthiazole kinase [Hyphomicrobiales bacterium]
MSSSHRAELSAALLKLRAERPLIHNITNFVVMNFTANVLLAAGASPAMVHAAEEAGAFAALSRALVINIGTLDAGFVAGMDEAVASATAHQVPWVLDPVGVGATPYRTEVALRLSRKKPAVIRGNASEIMALAGAAGSGRGVDSLSGSEEAIEAGRRLSHLTGAVVAVTGATDYVIAGGEVIPVTGGHAISQQVTGTGCATTALVGAFLAVASPKDAAITGLALMKRAAELAEPGTPGPGSFATMLIDAIAAIR